MTNDPNKKTALGWIPQHEAAGTDPSKHYPTPYGYNSTVHSPYAQHAQQPAYGHPQGTTPPPFASQEQPTVFVPDAAEQAYMHYYGNQPTQMQQQSPIHGEVMQPVRDNNARYDEYNQAAQQYAQQQAYAAQQAQYAQAQYEQAQYAQQVQNAQQYAAHQHAQYEQHAQQVQNAQQYATHQQHAQQQAYNQHGQSQQTAHDVAQHYAAQQQAMYEQQVQAYYAQQQAAQQAAQQQVARGSQPAQQQGFNFFGKAAAALQQKAESGEKKKDKKKKKERPIANADATAGSSAIRVGFIRRTYLHLFLAIISFATLLFIFRTVEPVAELLQPFVNFAVHGGRWNWGIVLAIFMATSWVADYWASHAKSRAMQYAGLLLYVVAEAIIFVPLLYVVQFKLGDMGVYVVRDAAYITLGIFLVLTLSVFITKKDFSFLRSGLVMASGAALVLIAMSIMFGFQLGMIFSFGMVFLAALYILYQTSQILAHYDPNQHVAASLALFSSVALMFWYVIRILMKLREE